MEKVGSKVLHSVNRVAALALLFASGQNLAQGWREKENAEVSIGLELAILKVNIILQIVELVLVAWGKIKGNTRRHLLLLLDRSLLAFLFLSPESDRILFLCLAFLYSTADTLRYWTLIFSKGSYLPLLRYLFPLLAGLFLPYLSLALSNNYIKINAE